MPLKMFCVVGGWLGGGTFLGAAITLFLNTVIFYNFIPIHAII